MVGFIQPTLIKDMSKRLREFLYKKFGIQYAEDFLLG